MGEDDTYSRNTPINELDLQLMIVDTEWGKDVAPELMERLAQIGEKLETTPDGKIKVSRSKLWGLLSYYTRDLRLGNIDYTVYIVCTEWLDFAGDCLRIGAVSSFLTSLSYVITRLELSQSRNGFLRKRLGTFTQEHFNEFSDKNNKGGLFKNKKTQESGY